MAPKLHVNSVIGHPWDTKESIDETLTFARELEQDFGARCGYGRTLLRTTSFRRNTFCVELR